VTQFATGQAASATSKGAPATRKIGIVLTVLVALFWIMDAAMKLANLPQVAETMEPLGWPADPATILALGAIQAACLVLYLVPRTAVLGAILLTAFLGGAIATHARVGSPLPSHTLFGVYVGLFTWAGLWFRIPELRTLIPFRSNSKD
jgi:uncharacterized membrane protein YphA (DoxX/SURF4 family)